jgi:hypothetical protein
MLVSTNPLTQHLIPQEWNLSYTTVKSSKLAGFSAIYTTASYSSAIHNAILTLILLWNSQMVQNYQYQSPAGHSSKAVTKSLTQFYFTKIHLSTTLPFFPKFSMNVSTKILHVFIQVTVASPSQQHCVHYPNNMWWRV